MATRSFKPPFGGSLHRHLFKPRASTKYVPRPAESGRSLRVPLNEDKAVRYWVDQAGVPRYQIMKYDIASSKLHGHASFVPILHSYWRSNRLDIVKVDDGATSYYEIFPEYFRTYPESEDFEVITKERPVGLSDEDMPNQSKQTIPPIWLRDQCQCAQCIHPDTKQRHFDTFSIPEDLKITDVKIDAKTLNLTFSDGHHTQVQESWIHKTFNRFEHAERLRAYTKPVFWDNINVQQQPPEVDYDAIMHSKQGLADWTRKIQDYGFCFVKGCPETPEATEQLLSRIGPIRNTHYGAFWDFTSDLSKKDMAYTSEGLPPHTDTNYFTEPARLQLFHLLSHTEGSGGESQLVDGFRVARELLNQNEEHFQTLARVSNSWHASGNEGVSLQPTNFQSVFTHSGVTGRLERIRWNNEDRARMMPQRPTQIQRWYDGARAFDKLTKTDNKAWYYDFKLQPGRPLIFDNWRVLHGRSAFTGKRRMCGGYINQDDFISTFKLTNWGTKAVMDSIY